MLPKLNQRRGYASKCRILLCRSLALKQGEKPVVGQVIVHAGGQELREITATLKGFTVRKNSLFTHHVACDISHAIYI
jgi:hypothetical protein